MQNDTLALIAWGIKGPECSLLSEAAINGLPNGRVGEVAIEDGDGHALALFSRRKQDAGHAVEGLPSLAAACSWPSMRAMRFTFHIKERVSDLVP